MNAGGPFLGPTVNQLGSFMGFAGGPLLGPFYTLFDPDRDAFRHKGGSERTPKFELGELETQN